MQTVFGCAAVHQHRGCAFFLQTDLSIIGHYPRPIAIDLVAEVDGWLVVVDGMSGASAEHGRGGRSVVWECTSC